MTSMIERHRQEQRAAAKAALNRLVGRLSSAGITLPSPSVDRGSPYTGIVLVELGRVTAAVVDEIADLIGEGLAHRAQRQN